MSGRPNKHVTFADKAPMTSKPCPGCAGVVERSWFDGSKRPDQFRRADQVCDDCKDLMEEARATRERVAKESLREIRDVTSPSYGERFVGHDERDIRRIFQDLIFAVSEDVAANRDRYGAKEVGESKGLLFSREKKRKGSLDAPRAAGRVLIHPLVAQLLDELDARIAAAMQAKYTEGACDGSRILKQLAEGETTPDQFEKALQRVGVKS